MAGYVTGWDVLDDDSDHVLCWYHHGYRLQLSCLKKTKPFCRQAGSLRYGASGSTIFRLLRTVLLHVWERCKGFIKQGRYYPVPLLCVVMWFLGTFGVRGWRIRTGRIPQTACWLSSAAHSLRCLLLLAWASWQAVASAIFRFQCKRGYRFHHGCTCKCLAVDVEECRYPLHDAVVGMWFPNGNRSGISFLLFNLFDSPCLAAISTMAQQMQRSQVVLVRYPVPEHLCLRSNSGCIPAWQCSVWLVHLVLVHRSNHCSGIHAVHAVPSGPVQGSEDLLQEICTVCIIIIGRKIGFLFVTVKVLKSYENDFLSGSWAQKCARLLCTKKGGASKRLIFL